MVSLEELENQLRKRGIVVRFWCRPELKELPKLLVPNEQVHLLVNGEYEGGFAMLVGTDQRVILLDKKPLFLTIESLQYDMISEVDYNARLLDSSLNIITLNKSLRFTSFRQKRLRDMHNFIQEQVMLRRQQQVPWAQQPSQYLDPQAQPVREPAVMLNFVPHPHLANPYTRAALTVRRTFLPRLRRGRGDRY